MKEIFFHLYPPKGGSIGNVYVPLSLIDYYSKDNKYSFKKKSNPIYLLKDLLDDLDSELNTHNNENKVNNSNKSDKKDTISNGMKYILETNDSPIFKIFCFTKIDESICEYCFGKIYDLKIYNSFKLNIFECYSSYNQDQGNIILILQYSPKIVLSHLDMKYHHN